MLQGWSRPRDFAPAQDINDIAFYNYFKIGAVAIVFGAGARFNVSEFNSSRNLLRELWRLGRKRIPLRGMISELGALDRASLRALNVYLEHYYGRQSYASAQADGLHRYRWRDMQAEVRMRWVR